VPSGCSKSLAKMKAGKRSSFCEQKEAKKLF